MLRLTLMHHTTGSSTHREPEVQGFIGPRTNVPEPSMPILLGIGIGGMALVSMVEDSKSSKKMN